MQCLALCLILVRVNVGFAQYLTPGRHQYGRRHVTHLPPFPWWLAPRRQHLTQADLIIVLHSLATGTGPQEWTHDRIRVFFELQPKERGPCASGDRQTRIFWGIFQHAGLSARKLGKSQACWEYWLPGGKIQTPNILWNKLVYGRKNGENTQRGRDGRGRECW